MRILVERGEIYKCTGINGDRFVIVTSVHVDHSHRNFCGQVWVGCREVVANGDPPPSAFPDNSPLRGFTRGAPFTSYLTARDNAWRMNTGWELVGWGDPGDEEPQKAPVVAASDKAAVEIMSAAVQVKKRGRPPKEKTVVVVAGQSNGQLNEAANDIFATCPEHPTYRGLRKCRSGCKTCEKIYELKHVEADPLAD